jgi:pimeloyl-ACP methyl ester carboxylesterase
MSEATSNAPLTVVLVHGAFADSSSWDGVIEHPRLAWLDHRAAEDHRAAHAARHGIGFDIDARHRASG